MRTRTWQSIWFPAVYLLTSRISCFMLYCVCFCVVVRPIHFDAVTNSRCGCFVVASIFMFVVEMICDVCIFVTSIYLSANMFTVYAICDDDARPIIFHKKRTSRFQSVECVSWRLRLYISDSNCVQLHSHSKKLDTKTWSRREYDIFYF